MYACHGFFQLPLDGLIHRLLKSPGRFRQEAVEALQAGWTQEATRLKALTGMKAGSGRKTISRGKETWQKKSM
jgi:hypothetical protein